MSLREILSDDRRPVLYEFEYDSNANKRLISKAWAMCDGFPPTGGEIPLGNLQTDQ
jgi:hypothetical protein